MNLQKSQVNTVVVAFQKKLVKTLAHKRIPFLNFYVESQNVKVPCLHEKASSKSLLVIYIQGYKMFEL